MPKNIKKKIFIDLPCFTYISSCSNTFILRHRTITAMRLFEVFKRFGLILNPIKSAYEKVEDYYLRVVLGSDEDNKAFCEICKKVNDIEYKE